MTNVCKHIIECFAIRQKSTGNFLPQALGRRVYRGGHTHDEPTPVHEKLPRLFLSEQSAKSALKWWLAGKTEKVWVPNYPDGEMGPDLVTTGVPGRNAEDMEVVTVRLEVLVGTRRV